MVGTFPQRFTSALKETCFPWILGLLRGQSKELEEGRENSIPMGRLREKLYAKAVIGSG